MREVSRATPRKEEIMDQAEMLTLMASLYSKLVNDVAEKVIAKTGNYVSDTAAERVSELAAQVFEERIEAALEKFDATEVVARAIDAHDFDSKIEAAIDGYDFDDKVETAIDDYDFDDKMESAIDNLGLDDKVNSAISDYDFTDKVVAVVEGLTLRVRIG